MVSEAELVRAAIGVGFFLGIVVYFILLVIVGSFTRSDTSRYIEDTQQADSYLEWRSKRRKDRKAAWRVIFK